MELYLLQRVQAEQSSSKVLPEFAIMAALQCSRAYVDFIFRSFESWYVGFPADFIDIPWFLLMFSDVASYD